MAREMRYERGVPLTEEERAGGGYGAGRSFEQGNLYSGMDLSLGPYAGNWLGMLGNMWGPATQGGGSQEGAYLRQLLELARQQEANRPTIERAYEAKAFAGSPVARAIAQGEASRVTRNADPWAPGGAFEGRRASDLYTPEALLASQGRTAENQWARLGGRKDINQQEFERLADEVARLRRTYI